MKKILVWIPLPPDGNWRGEGIAQTLEQWLINFGSDYHFNLFVNAKTAECLDEVLTGRVSYTIHCYQPTSRHGTKEKVEVIDLRAVDTKVSMVEYFKRYVNKLFGFEAKYSRIWSMVLYSLILRVATFLLNRRFIFRDVDLIWAPVPSVPFVEYLKGKIVFNFWDPFVLEYSEFSRLSPIFIGKFRQMFSPSNSSAVVVTQSIANKDFVSGVFSVPKDRVHVVRLGCPDYSVHVAEVANGIRSYKESKGSNVFELWPSSGMLVGSRGMTRSALTQRRNHLMAQHSIFFRLAKNIAQNSKIIFISTQNRPYKGLALVVKILARLRAECPGSRFHIVTTCSVPERIKELYPELFEAMVEFHRLPNKNHALITAISDLVLHPSFVEGGLGSYSMFEAASVGVPSLTNVGRHTEEIKQWVGNEIEIAFEDFTDIEAALRRMKDLLFDEARAEEVVKALRGAWYGWDDSTRTLSDVFTSAIS